MLDQFADTIFDITSSDRSEYRTLLPYREGKNEEILSNDFLLLVKPECFRGNSFKNIFRLLGDVDKCLGKFNVLINGVYAFNWHLSVATNFVEQHYFVLNRAANRDADGIPDEMRDKYAQGDQVIGAFRFLQIHPHITSTDIEQLAHRQGTTKLSNGIYGSRIQVLEKRFFVINAFHPEQVARLNSPKGVFLALICRSQQSYRVLTGKMVGNFVPANATAGSLRNMLYKQATSYGINRVDVLFNGFHISPSPLEAIFSIERLLRIFGDAQFQPSQSNIGNTLGWSNANSAEWRCLGKNPLVDTDIGKCFLFDLIEDLDSAQIVTVLEKLRGHPIIK